MLVCMQPPNPRNVGNATLQDSVVGGDLHTGNIIHNHYHVTQTPAPVQTSVQQTVTPSHLQEPQQNQVVYVNSMNNSLGVGEKDLVTAYLLCIFFGWLGGHRFYLDQFNMGLLYVFTFGFLGFGTLIDLILLPELVRTRNQHSLII